MDRGEINGLSNRRFGESTSGQPAYRDPLVEGQPARMVLQDPERPAKVASGKSRRDSKPSWSRRSIPHLEWTDTGAYVLWFDNGTGRKRRLSLRTDDAVEAAERFAEFVRHGGGPAKLTCGVALEHYLDEHVEKGPVVDKQRQRDAIRNLNLYFREMRVVDVAIPHSREYAEKRMSGGLGLSTIVAGKVRTASAGTVRRELATLLAAVRHCIAWRKPGISPADLPSVEYPPVARTKGMWFFPDELAVLREAADPLIRDFIDLAYHTAARRHSIETLTWAQVDLTGGRINLAKPADPSTKKRKPIVRIDAPLMVVLKRLYDAKTNEWVLGSNRPLWIGFEKALRKARMRELPSRDMRVAGKASPHLLRHSWATHALAAGAKPIDVANRLGDTVETVLRVYGHACPSFGDVGVLD